MKEKKGIGSKSIDSAPNVPAIPSYLLERNLTEEDRRMAEDRELSRKRAEDPMTKYCVYESSGDGKNNTGSSRLFLDASQIESKEEAVTVEGEGQHRKRSKEQRDDLITSAGTNFIYITLSIMLYLYRL